jgi:putative PIN family toxin of toxin-antitoxin system
MIPRVVFDTNIWIAGLNWRGASYRCLLLARTGVVKPIYCQPMIAELATKLREKFLFSENDIRAVRYEIGRVGELVTITGELRTVAADPDDDKFIECAIAGNADLLVSEDKHLLSLATGQAFRIVNARELLAQIGSS